MTRNIFKTEQPVVLEGYQAVMKASKFGFSLKAIVDDEMADRLDHGPYLNPLSGQSPN
jgi:hypothetical protein